MTGIIVSNPPPVQPPPTSTSGGTQVLGPLAYTPAIPTLPQTWSGVQTFLPGTIVLSGTGAASNVVMQETANGPLTVRQLAFTDISGNVSAAQGGFGVDISGQSGVPLFASGAATFIGTTGSGNFVRATSPTIATPTLGATTIATGADNTTFLTVTGAGGNGRLTGSIDSSSNVHLQTPLATSLVLGANATDVITITSTGVSLAKALTYGGVTLNNAVTGTGNMVLSSNPTITLANATGLPISSGVSGLATGIATFLATPSSANLRAAVTDETGTGSLVFQNGALGTPTSATLTNATGLPIGGISATGTPSSTTYLRGDGTWGTPAGSGTVTSITAGTGLTASPGSPITSAGTLSIDTTVVPRLGVANTFTATNTFAGGAAGTPSIIGGSAASSGIWFPSSSTVALSGNGTEALRVSNSGQGRASAFQAMWTIPASAGNGISFKGSGTSGAIGVLDFSDSSLVQAGGIVIDQGAHTTTYNTSSDMRAKPNRELLSLDAANQIISALKIWDFDKDGNVIRGVGVLAQEAYQILPRMVAKGDDNSSLTPDDNGYIGWSADRAYPVPYMIVAMQGMMKRIDDLENEVSQLKG